MFYGGMVRRKNVLNTIMSSFFIVGLASVTITQVMGCGNQKGWKEYYRGSELFLNVLPKVQLSMVVNDDRVDRILEIIIGTAHTDDVGDGKILVTNVERVIRIRNGEEGESAL